LRTPGPRSTSLAPDPAVGDEGAKDVRGDNFRPLPYRRCANSAGTSTDANGRRWLAPVLRPGSGQMTSARQRGQNPVCSFGHAHFGQDVDIIAQKPIDLDEATVFCNRLGETMPSFLV
jgi:hypothetical protein